MYQEPPVKIYAPSPPDWEKLERLSQSTAPDKLWPPGGTPVRLASGGTPGPA